MASGGYLRANVPPRGVAASIHRPAVSRILPGCSLDSIVPVLDLPASLRAEVRGVTQDPANPLFREVAKNYLKSRLRSHPDVARKYHADLLEPSSAPAHRPSPRPFDQTHSRKRIMTGTSKNFETLALHGGTYRADPTTGAVAIPLYQTTSYQFQDTAMRRGSSRWKNWATSIPASRTRHRMPSSSALPPWKGCRGAGGCLGAGQPPHTRFSTWPSPADNIVSSTDLYGGTVTLLSQTLKAVRRRSPLRRSI